LQIERDRMDVVDTQLGQRPSEDHDIHTCSIGTAGAE